MMGDIDWFGEVFAAFPEGSIAKYNARVALNMVRNGLAVVAITPNDKVARCWHHLDARAKKAADKAAQEAGTAKRDGTHRCAVHCVITEESQLKRTGAKKLLDSGINLAVSLAHSTRRVMIVDVDTDAERRAFLADWAEFGDNVDPNTPLTVRSPGVYDNAADVWKHKDGGHLWLNVPDGVELPAKGEAKWCSCHKFTQPGDKCERAWSLFWTGTERYVLVPPSVRQEGPYLVTGQALDAPEWLVKIAQESAERAPREWSGELNTDDGDPINAWSSSTPWSDLLTSAGWDENDTDSCGCATWTRPGHANRKTATAHDPGCSARDTDGGHGTLHLWTDAWRPYGPGKADLTKLQFYAATCHGCDIRAAMTALGIDRKRANADTGHTDDLFVLGDARGKAPAPGNGATDTGEGADSVQAPDVAAFWDARPVLRNIHDLAWSELCAPWAVLGAVLGYVTALTPPRVKVNDMSLNLFVGLVGPPGSGKDTAIKAARKWIGDLAGDDRLYQRSIGSGQGMESAFVARVKEKSDDGDATFVNKQIRENVLVKVSEVDQITSHAKQQASTLVANLRSAWMAQALGGMYKDTTKDIAVGEDTYRLSVLVGIQPSRAKALIEDATGGLPQRFLWVPTTDRSIPDNFAEFRPEPMEWKPPVKCRDMADPFVLGEDVHREPDVEMDLCQRALDEMNTNRLARARGTWDGDALSTHDDLGRLKIAAALALLDGRTDVRDEDWDLAGVVAQVSKYVRGRVVHGLEAEDRKKREAEHKALAEAAVEVEKAKTESALEQAKAKVRSVLARQTAGEWLKSAKVRGSITRSARPNYEDAVSELVESGVVEREDRENGFVLRLRVQ
jgi:hypothetical protein